VPRNEPEIAPQDVLKANIEFHSALAASYDRDQPHFRPENRALVSAKLRRYAEEVGNRVMVDLGCGTGFMVQLALPWFRTIYGFDVTHAMISQIGLSSGRVVICQADTGFIPVQSGVADLVTANTFLHHLYDLRPTVAEAWRVLKNGGVFYSEEDPNFYFWDALKDLPATQPGLLQREIDAVQKTDEIVEDTCGVAASTVRIAEFQKMIRGGMKPEELKNLFEDVGFSSVNIQPYWFLGQSSVHHDQSAEDAQTVDNYLRRVLPLSIPFFKYLRIEARK